MTSKQAITQARKRWGKLALAEDRGPQEIPPEKRSLFRRYNVGKYMDIGGISFFEVKGWGDTWEDAFKMADDKEQADKERWAKLRAEAARKS